MGNGIQGSMSLLGLTFKLFELLGRNSQGFVFASVEVEAQHFNEDGIGLIHSDGEVHNVFLSVETEWLTFGIEDRRPSIVSMSAILSLWI